MDLSKISVQDFDKGGVKVRGMAARQAFAAGDEVMSIPYGRLLTSVQPKPASFAESPACAAVWTAASTQEKVMVNMLHLRHANGLSKDEVVARDYLALLPTSEQYRSFHPLAADPSAFAGFEALPISSAVTKFRKAEKAFYEKLDSNKCLGFDTSLDDYMWAFVALRSRVFGAQCPGDVDGVPIACSAFVPLSDMVNTVPGGVGNTNWGFNADKSAWVVRARRPIEKGQEITDTYKNGGTDEDTYRIWGFTSRQNPHPVSKLPAGECAEMLPAAKKYLNGDLDGCRDGVGGVQCSLATLASEHCSESWA